MNKFRRFDEDLINELRDFEEVKAYLLNAVEDEDEDFLLDAMKLIVQAWGPTKISEIAGGSKQRWESLKNPTFKTTRDFLGAFGLKITASEKTSTPA